jgi:tetratricopeptide (TPR) repeat protein
MYNAPGGTINVYQAGSTSGGQSIPRQLQPPPAYFVNRDQELVTLRHLLGDPAGAPRRTVVVLSGPPGVGKTGLALYWAHEVSQHYPDGHFFRNLSGYGPGPGDVAADPFDVLADWLSLVWGLKRSEIPTSREGRRELFRARTAGQRVLMILDNAARADQIRPLLPTPESCLVIVTSRNRLSGLVHDGARSVEVDLLPPEKAIELLRERVGDRIDMDPSASAQLAKYCAYLPLTLHTAATHLGNEPDRSVAVQVGRLSDERRRLYRLGHPDDQETDVEAVNSLSYRRLPPEAQRLFRLLALHPASGGTAGVYSVSRLAGLDLGATEDLLDLLERESVISKIGDRYGSRHDVLHLYARQLIDQEEHAVERREALDRLAHAYYGCVNHAFDRVNRDNPMVDAEFLSGWRHGEPEGVASVDDVGKPAVWFAGERLNLVALVRAAGDITPPLAITPRLACCLFYFLETGGYLADWDEVEEVAARVAFTCGDHHDQARSLRNQARIILVKILDDQERRRNDSGVGPPPADGYLDAVAMLERSRDLYRAAYAAHGERRDRAGEATALRELADLHRLQADSSNSDAIDKAIGAYREAERAYEELGNDNGLASLRLALGIAYALKDDPADLARAERCIRASLDYSSQPNEIGTPQHPRLKGYALRHLGDLCRRRNNFTQAISSYEQAIETFHDANDAISEGRAFAEQGRILTDYSRDLLDAGDRVGARDALTRARTSSIQAMELLSALPHEVESITNWLNRLDTLAHAVDSAATDGGFRATATRRTRQETDQ